MSAARSCSWGDFEKLIWSGPEKGQEAMTRFFARVMLALCLAVAAGFNAQAQTKPKVTSLGPDFPKAALFVGNSFFYYNNGMPGHLTFMERAMDPANKAVYRNTMVTIGGSGLDWHDMDNLLRPGGLGAYSFDERTTSSSTSRAGSTTPS
ncbi:hypothetical protein [Bradyrhizobium sp. MOS003]|uniref:hypothetical protein n=1 Tax=Bradyrhizobium sp. MOS003 TaxID=2133946 RepID=UPI001FE15727|nr:hypothetical protein [Bradyrhizobium sp. MOS003]